MKSSGEVVVPVVAGASQAESGVDFEWRQVPENVAELVEVRGERLVLRDCGHRAFQPFIGSLLAMQAVVFGAALLSGIGAGFINLYGGTTAAMVVASLPAVIGGALAVLLPVLGAFKTFRSTEFSASPEGVGLSSRWMMSPEEVSRLTLTGEVGKLLVVRLEGEPNMRVLAVRPHPGGGGWDYPAVVWFARAVANRLDVPLLDSTDHASWMRWTQVKAYRLRLAFERRIQESMERDASLHRQPPVEPEALEMDHHGWRVGTSISVDHTEIRDEKRRVPLEEILDIGVVFEDGYQAIKGNHHDCIDARLLVLTESRLVALGLRQFFPFDKRTAEWLWIVEKVQEQINKQVERPDKGTVDDVPEAMRGLRNL